ncbi:MAG: polymer-forming cytoskeletal protein [Coriobacteriia bacterium]|nr:polymer-forming cytoskeletal protein [Coriobacteriia bacterium]
MDESTNNSLNEENELDTPVSDGRVDDSSQTVLDIDDSGQEDPKNTGDIDMSLIEEEDTSKAALSSTLVPNSSATSTNGFNAEAGNSETGEKGISIIAREATVLGDIITEGHIDIIGKVRGNIAAQGDVAIHGQVRGNIDGEKIGLYNSRVKGNLKAGQGVIVNDTSIIDGDVTTKNIIFDGKVRGNIAADNVVVFRSHSYCLGDVTAASIAVEPGAVINGTVRTIIEGDLEAPFEEII